MAFIREHLKSNIHNIQHEKKYTLKLTKCAIHLRLKEAGEFLHNYVKYDEIKCRELLTMISESIFKKNLEGLTYKERTDIRIKELIEQKNQQIEQKETENKKLKKEIEQLKKQISQMDEKN